MGTRSFIESYVQKLVSEWVRELERLSSFAISQPHAAYVAFMYGFTSKWTFLVRTTTYIGSLLKPLEDTIRLKFLPALTDKNAPNNREQALPACLHACMHGWHWHHHQPISTVSITLFHLKEYLSPCSNLPPTQPTGKRRAKSDAYQTRRQQVPMNCLTRSLTISNELWRLLKKRVHQAGSHPSQLQNMALIYIKELLEMPSVSGMSGNHHTCHQTVCICGKQYTIEHAVP